MVAPFLVRLQHTTRYEIFIRHPIIFFTILFLLVGGVHCFATHVPRIGGVIGIPVATNVQRARARAETLLAAGRGRALSSSRSLVTVGFPSVTVVSM